MKLICTNYSTVTLKLWENIHETHKPESATSLETALRTEDHLLDYTT